jgi:hypothetical protein
VLTIIGFVIGGVLVGQSLIQEATIRAQITQIPQFNTAVRTFQTKYDGYLPGDIPDPAASSFGFLPRGTTGPCQGNGNGLIEGDWLGACAYNMQGGEAGMVWVDLSTAGLIDGSFHVVQPNESISTWPNGGQTLTSSTNPTYDVVLPAAKIGNGNYIFVYNVAESNWFGINGLTYFNHDGEWAATNNLTVAQAYNIDKKIDDGIPMTGTVLAYTGGLEWANGGASYDSTVPRTARTPASATTCYDNGDVTGVMPQYSLAQNNGGGMNCALGFEFQ